MPNTEKRNRWTCEPDERAGREDGAAMLILFDNRYTIQIAPEKWTDEHVARSLAETIVALLNEHGVLP